MLRAICFVTGAIILAATAHAAIMAGNGYGDPKSYLIMAIALGIAVGAVGVGAAWAQRRFAIAVGLIFALAAGEAFGLLMTAERIVASREAAQAPARALAKARTAAESRLAAAERARNAFPGTSERLKQALVAKAAADAATIEKSALRGCRKHCRALLEKQTTDAQREIDSARRDLDIQHKQLAAAVIAARSVLADIPTPKSGTPLADRLQLPPWIIDVTAAALASLAANGLACLLIAFSGHYRAPVREEQLNAEYSLPPSSTLSALDHVDQFAATMFRPDPVGRVRLMQAHDAYKRWCESRDEKPLSDIEFVDAFAALLRKADLDVVSDNKNDPAIVGMSFIPMIEAAAA